MLLLQALRLNVLKQIMTGEIFPIHSNLFLCSHSFFFFPFTPFYRGQRPVATTGARGKLNISLYLLVEFYNGNQLNTLLLHIFGIIYTNSLTL